MDTEIKLPNVSQSNISPKRSGIIIGLYFIIFFLLSGLITFIVLQFPNTLKDQSATESMVIELQLKYSVGYLKKNDYDKLPKDQKDRIDVYEIDDDYVIVSSKGLLKDEQFPKDINVLFGTDDLFFSESEDASILTFKVNRVGFLNNEDFITHYGITPSFDVKVEALLTYTDNAATIILFIVYVIGVVTISRIAFKSLKEDSLALPPTRQTLRLVLISILIMYLGNFASGLFTLFSKLMTNDNSITSLNQFAIEQQFGSNLRILSFITIVAFAPVVEELVFRKAAFALFKNQWVALVVSSLLFGIIHVIGEGSITAFFVNLIPYLIAGAVLGYIYIRNKYNIWISIFTHLAANALSVVMMLLL